MNVIHNSEQRIPIKAWCDDVEVGALDQAQNLTNLPFAFKHIALMPDVHQGYGMPVGGVLATRGYVVPNAVGVDIGCGMIAVRTDVPAWKLAEPHKSGGTVLQYALGEIMRMVPVGLPPTGVHAQDQGWDEMPSLDDLIEKHKGVNLEPLRKAWNNAPRQLGTLGSGNHFLEVQSDEQGRVWVMLHSGSRALGKAVCDLFTALATALNERYFSQVPKAWDLAFLPTDDELGRAYMACMNACLAYAEENRGRMCDRMVEALALSVGSAKMEETIQTHHNYAVYESHFGQNVIVHRKGACRSRDGELVIIPGSMETGSYIGKGKGHAESFQSCSHGAGRRMSRGQARKSRTVQDMVESLKAKGIALATHKVESVLDEAGHAYKDVDAVMANEVDLVEAVVKLRPLGVVKG